MEDRLSLWEELSEDLLTVPGVDRSTMMRFPCLRVNGGFFASFDARSHHLIVKVPEERVTELVGAGVGESFAPAGRVFRRWVTIPEPDRERWGALMREALEFVGEND